MSSPQLNAERLYMPAEVARLFRVDVKTVTRWAKAGKLTTIRTLGGHRRYRADEVDALLKPETEAPSAHCGSCGYLRTAPGHLAACGSAS